MKQKYWISIIAALLVIYPSAFYFYTNGIRLYHLVQDHEKVLSSLFHYEDNEQFQIAIL